MEDGEDNGVGCTSSLEKVAGTASRFRRNLALLLRVVAAFPDLEVLASLRK